MIVFTKKDLNSAIWIFIGMIILGILEVVGVVSIVPFMAVVANPQIVEENEYLNMIYVLGEFDNHSDFSVFLGFLMMCVIILINGYSAFMKWKITYFVRAQGYRLEMRMLKYYLSQHYVFFLNRSLPDIGKNILTEVERVVGGIVHPGLEVMSKGIVMIFIFALLIVVDPIVALSVFFLLGGSYLILFLLIKNKQKEMGLLTTAVIHDRFKLVNQVISGIKEIKLQGSEGSYVRHYDDFAKDYSNYLARNLIISQLPRYALETLAFGSIIVVIILSILRGDSGSDIIPMVSLYALAGYRLLPSLQTIFSSLTKIKFHLPILDILTDDLSKFTSANFDRSKTKLEVNKNIEFHAISYTYPNAQNPSLDQLNLVIEPNTIVGIVGGTGAGKTTLIDLLLGLLSIEYGRLSVNGVDITPQNIQSWQNSLGYVPQSIYLTDDTIASNIAFGIDEDNINFEDVVKSGEMAMLGQFIDTLPDGYMTMVGERGVRLSGGQRQRIGIARALYSKPNVLIMDEATSALDGITEDTVMQSIKKISHKKTIILIAHRLTTVEQCDVIHVMDNGKIVDSGTYDYLLENNNEFRKMAKVKK